MSLNKTTCPSGITIPAYKIIGGTAVLSYKDSLLWQTYQTESGQENGLAIEPSDLKRLFSPVTKNVEFVLWDDENPKNNLFFDLEKIRIQNNQSDFHKTVYKAKFFFGFSPRKSIFCERGEYYAKNINRYVDVEIENHFNSGILTIDGVGGNGLAKMYYSAFLFGLHYFITMLKTQGSFMNLSFDGIRIPIPRVVEAPLLLNYVVRVDGNTIEEFLISK